MCRGSSPRTWGTPRSAAHWIGESRFIPTHVGNTKAASFSRAFIPVHPHARGEHWSPSWRRFDKRGSSPRTWGTRCENFRRSIQSRFIPTHVGNTGDFTNSMIPPSVHPHARGEHSSLFVNIYFFSGSSPRTWGTPRRHSRGPAGRRFIPTHVGNTKLSSGKRGRHTGSSPRTWGTLSLNPPPPEPLRFIPTHVGNTYSGCVAGERASVHPHARGEHRSALIRTSFLIGSSPRTWGTLKLSQLWEKLRRFIPTHVGNTQRPGPSIP